jgi:hypothetical protein
MILKSITLVSTGSRIWTDQRESSPAKGRFASGLQGGSFIDFLAQTIVAKRGVSIDADGLILRRNTVAVKPDEQRMIGVVSHGTNPCP